jgi:hypothetical protein
MLYWVWKPNFKRSIAVRSAQSKATSCLIYGFWNLVMAWVQISSNVLKFALAKFRTGQNSPEFRQIIAA